MLHKTIRSISIMMLWVLCSFSVSAQQGGFYIPKSGKIFFIGDSAAIFSNVLNEGNLGIGNKAVIQFKGQQWENDHLSLITDESNNGTGVSGLGGIIRFSADSLRQSLIGGYNAATRLGPAFPALQIHNSLGVDINTGSVKVLREVALSNGLVHLNGNIFILGNNHPGLISGYDSSKFFVTGTQANGGLLVRENIKDIDGQVVFPVGTQKGSYTPAAIKSRSAIGDDYYVAVFDSVKANMVNGDNLVDESVNKTWQIGKTFRPGEDEVEIYLQHLNRDEGSRFTLNRERAYISQFTGTIWDTGFPQNLPAGGSLTSGTLLFNSGLNSRSFQSTLSGASYFTKFAGPGDTAIKTRLLLGAHRVNHNTVNVRWQTNPEVNVRYFVVERRFSNQSTFTAVDTVSSQSLSSINLSTLIYEINDPNSYRGISFYRLKIVERNNWSYYSNTVAVGGSSRYMVLLWPNPTPNKFNLIINSPEARSVVIFNNLGQKVWSTSINVNAQTYIEIKDHHLLPGTYFVSALDQQGRVLQTEKLLIVDN